MRRRWFHSRTDFPLWWPGTARPNNDGIQVLWEHATPCGHGRRPLEVRIEQKQRQKVKEDTERGIQFLQWTGNEPKCKQKISVLLCEESNSSQFQFRSRLLCHLSCHKHPIVTCGIFFTVYFQVYFSKYQLLSPLKLLFYSERITRITEKKFLNKKQLKVTLRFY